MKSSVLLFKSQFRSHHDPVKLNIETNESQCFHFMPPLKLTAGVSMQIAIDILKCNSFSLLTSLKSPSHSDYLMKTLSVLLIEVALSIITL